MDHHLHEQWKCLDKDTQLPSSKTTPSGQTSLPSPP
jgi:hypothetical protein